MLHTDTCNLHNILRIFRFTNSCPLKVYAMLTMRSCQDKHWYMVCIWLNKTKKYHRDAFRMSMGHWDMKTVGFSVCWCNLFCGNWNGYYNVLCTSTFHVIQFKIFQILQCICEILAPFGIRMCSCVQLYALCTGQNHEIMQSHLYVWHQHFQPLCHHFPEFPKLYVLRMYVEHFPVRINCKWFWKM